MKKYYIYFMSDEHNNVLYIGVTNNLNKRVLEHKEHTDTKSFTYKYNCNKLVYFEEYANIGEAINREKQLKSWKRE